VRCSGQADGGMAGHLEEDEARRQALVAAPWTLLRQVHGARVVEVDRPGGGRGEAADAAVTAVPGAVLAVLTADCAPVALASPEGVLGVAHAGWRGLVAGVVEACVESMRVLGASEVEAVVGPCVHPECYSFGREDLQVVVDRYGPTVASQDAAGGPALDLAAGVSVALERAGARLVSGPAPCTSCDPGYWSWRARQDQRRQATVAWKS
jgi:polyphenol oxidase